MATTVVPPPASAPAAPATPSTPVTPAGSTSAPSTPQTPAPSTPAAPKSMEERLADGWKKAKESVPLEETTTSAPEVTEPEETTETITAPEGTETTETTEIPAETPETTAPEPDEFRVDLEDTGEPATPQALADALKNSPETQAFFEQHPELKNQVFGALRRDAENREIRQYVPDVATAKMVTGYASIYQRLDAAFLKAQDPKNVGAFLTEWVKEAMLLGNDGKPLVGADGKYQMHPSLNNIFEHIFSNKLSVLKERAKSSGNERLQTALNVLTEELTPTSAAPGEVPDDLKPYADGLTAKEKALNEREETLNRQQRESAGSQRTQAIDRTEEKVAKSVTSQLQTKFKEAGLSQFEQDAAFAKIGAAITEALGEIRPDGTWSAGSSPAAPWFQSEYDRLAAQLPNPEAEKQLSKLIFTHTNELLGKHTARVIREAKGGAIERQTAKQTKVAGQADASRVEPKGTSVTTAPGPQQMSPAQMHAQVVKDLTQSLGREPDMNEIHKEMFKRVGKLGRRPA